MYLLNLVLLLILSIDIKLCCIMYTGLPSNCVPNAVLQRALTFFSLSLFSVCLSLFLSPYLSLPLSISHSYHSGSSFFPTLSFYSYFLPCFRIVYRTSLNSTTIQNH